MKDFTIENMALYHLDDIMEIEQKCYGKHHWSRDSFAAELDNPTAKYLVALNSSKKAVGYIGLWKIFDEGHVTNLAVHPDYQNKGLAHFIILSAIENCYRDKIKYITLEVRVSNEKAKKVYDNFGFKSLGLRKKYYQDNGEDALIMWTEDIFSEKYKQIFENCKKHIENKENE